MESQGGSLAGRIAGPYRLLSSIGRGGMGEVYLADRIDRQYEKKVAVKVSFYAMSSDEAQQRFLREQQAMATLDHPHIVKLLDGGVTEDDIPYFVMDFVEGLPLAEYCSQKQLSLTARLELFRKICAAVHYAHQNLIVHRDIKPGNIVVTSDGEPKLLDFGLAKILKQEKHARLTAAGQSPMTLRYAAPEQIDGRPVTVSTDVYALGVLLYFLLTGRVPHYERGLADIVLANRILNDEIPKPSDAVLQPMPGEEGPDPLAGIDRQALSRDLQGDIDNILAKALHKAPADRYSSVDHLSEDLRRYCDNLPVSVSPSTFQYRARKLILRNRPAAIAASVAATLALAGIIGVIWQGRIAERERRKAEQRFHEVHELAGTLLFDFHRAIQNTPGTSAAQLLILNKASEYLARLAKDADGNPQLRIDLVTAYRRLGDIQGSQYSANAGQDDAALGNFQKAVALAEPLRATHTPAAQSALAVAHRGLAEAYMRRSRMQDAFTEARQAAATLEPVHKANPKNEDIASELIRSYNTLGDIQGGTALQNLGDFRGAIATYSQAIAVLDHQKSNPKFAAQPYILRIKLADVEDWIGEPRKALESYSLALAFFSDRMTKTPTDLYATRLTANLYTRMANSRNKLKEFPAAIDNVAAAAKIYERLAAADPKDRRAQADLVYVYRLSGSTHQKAGNIDRCIAFWRQGLTIVDRLAAASPNDEFNAQDYAELSVRLGNVLAGKGNAAEARPLLDQGLRAYRRLADSKQATAMAARDFAQALMDVQLKPLRNPPLALQYMDTAIARLKKETPYFLRYYGRAQCEAGQRPQGLATLDRGLRLLEKDAEREKSEFAREIAACNAG
ncbi:MAG: protein kinase [Bryobacteraceae bacterium]